ncbi:ceramide synthase 6 isoform X1 [Lingula anatina]|uniref:Ceramide synthase 6 isoform X1 n=1 Tax=Lingula anatina TaxID=7574 RepID=A0A1S3H7Z6_LINAN|nr:ceramide synthase 6 isoform X1 [Lingula anatina]|eukprot:XP_013382240.1 ceramide synthase 6 isoform X1 [Lingula anatina]
MEAWRTLCSLFWNERFWLPEGFTWKHLENTDNGIYHPQVQDLIWYPIPLAVVLLVLRLLFERYIAAPIAVHLGVKEKVIVQVPHNPILENEFKRNKNPSDKQLQAIVKQTDWTRRRVERWFRLRRNLGRPSDIVKFSENSWRFCFYLSAFVYGITILWDKPWFWETRNCWMGYPDQHVTDDVFWYYMLELAFYWSLSASQFADIKRKDFWEMFLHHIVTIFLMSMSWSNNYVRIGTLVLAVHDAADFWLEAAKMAKYAGRQKLCDFLFGGFALVWLITRLIIFPTRVIRSTLLEGHTTVKVDPFTYPFYWVYNILLTSLLVLHIFWFYLICKVAFTAFLKGKVEKDERSESEEQSSEEPDVLGGAGDIIDDHINHNMNEKK